MYNIGLVVGSLDDQFSCQVAEGAMQVASENGDNLFIIPVKYLNRADEIRNDLNQKFEYQYNFLITYALSHSLDAVILCLSTIAYRCNADEREAILKAFKGIPVLLVASKEEGYASVSYDNATGLKAGIEYMIKNRGCKHICMISGEECNTDSKERLNAYKDTLNKNGMIVTDEMVEYSDLFDRSHDFIEKLIQNNPNIDGLVCMNDMTATAAYDVFNKHGFKIGKDICVLGFDDWKDDVFMNPPLASVKADASQLGYQAGITIHNSLLNNNINEYSFSISDREALVNTSFVNRESVSGIEVSHISLTKETELSYIQKLNDMTTAKHQMNVITRDMLMFNKGKADNFSGFLKAFSLEGVQNCYLFLLDKPIEYHEDEYVNVVNNLYLKAYKQGNEITEYATNDKIYSKNELFRYDGFQHGQAGNYVVIDIYSREMQYGILICDLPSKYFAYVESICFLISLTTKIIDLLIKQENLLTSQEEMLQKLEQENLILNNISYIDELTGISNRRGFITKTMDIIRDTKYHKKTAVLCYVDLNYLKLINDKFSHAEGNYALRVCADVLKQVTGPDGIVGRIGGDEFAIFKIISNTEEGLQIKNMVQQLLEEINTTTGKSYEISMSIGVYEFEISKQCDLKELIKEADSRLYMDKENKKPFVQR